MRNHAATMIGIAAIVGWITTAAVQAQDPTGATPPPAPPTTRAPLRGKVQLVGKAPVRPRLAVGHDAHVCGSEIPDEGVIVDAQGALANVVVVLAGVPNAKPPPAVTPRLDQQGCRFVPHVQAAPQGSTLTIKSSDPVLHNVHAFLGARTVFNLAMPAVNRPATRRLDEAGIIKIRCDSGHTWMSAFIAVVPHQYYAVSGRDGSFKIDDIPAGTYKLRAWHEVLGAVEQTVTITTTGADTSLTFRASEEERPATTAVVDPITSAPPPQKTDEQQREGQRHADERARRLRDGRDVYVRYCATCHGRAGDGKGPSAQFTSTPPRDFTRGTYKFRMTPAGSPPTVDDLVRTIRFGVRYTQMPGWDGQLTRTQIEAVARYLTSLSDAFWSDAPPPVPITIPTEPRYDAASIERGRGLYAKMQCATCHGAKGAGDGLAAKTLRDDWAQPIRPADFTAGKIKGGCCGASIYRAITTGLAGTPMPSFAGALSDAERWDLAHFVLSLGKRSPALDYLGAPAGRMSTP